MGGIMSNRPWMPLNVADYLKDTRHLTTLEHGAYLLLIMRYWEDGELPDSEALIARYAGLTPDQWAGSRDILAALFGPGWTHKRIDAELARAAEVMEKRRASGKLGGSTRQANAKQTPANSQHTDKDKDTSSLRSDVGARTKRARRLREDEELPDDWRRDAEAEGLPASQHDLEWRKMRNWSLSAPKGAKTDWRAMWRNWAQKAAVDYAPKGQGPPGKAPQLADVFAFIGKQGNERQQERDDSSGVRPALPHLSAGGSG